MNPIPLTSHPDAGELADSLELVLSKGYRVQIAADQEEVFLHSLEVKGDLKQAFGAVREEITTLVDNLDYSGVRTALRTAILAHFIKAYNDVEKGLCRENKPGKTKG